MKLKEIVETKLKLFLTKFEEEKFGIKTKQSLWKIEGFLNLEEIFRRKNGIFFDANIHVCEKL